MGKYFFQFALPAFLTSSKINAQQTKVGELSATITTVAKDTVSRTAYDGMISLAPQTAKVRSKNMLTGKVTDETGVAIPFASIRLAGSNRWYYTDVNGHFSIPLKKRWKTISLSVYSIGHADVKEMIDRTGIIEMISIVMKIDPQNMTAPRDKGMMRGKVVVRH